VGDGVSGTHVQDIAAAETRPVARPRRLQLDPAGFLKAGSLWPVSKRTAAVLAVFAAGFAAFQHRDQLVSPAYDLSKSTPSNSLLPKDYGIYRHQQRVAG
jgi:hypothetical protein